VVFERELTIPIICTAAEPKSMVGMETGALDRLRFHYEDCVGEVINRQRGKALLC
jgi:hypothetical protein